MLSEAANKYIAKGNKLQTEEDKVNFISELFGENYDISWLKDRMNNKASTFEGSDHWKKVYSLTLSIAILPDSEIELLFDRELLCYDHITNLYLLSRLDPTSIKINSHNKSLYPLTTLWLNNKLFTWNEKLDAYNSSKCLRSYLDPRIKSILERNVILYENIRYNKSIISKSQLNEIADKLADFNFIHYRNYRYKIMTNKINFNFPCDDLLLNIAIYNNKFADDNISKILQRIDPSIVSTVYLRSRIVVSKKCVDLIKDALKQCNKFISFEDAEYWEQLLEPQRI